MFEKSFVYLVDDERDDISLLSYYFKRYTVGRLGVSLSFEAGIRDLAKLDQKPDLVLVDLGLLNGGGPLFIHEAKKVIPFDGVEFQLMTGAHPDEARTIVTLYKADEDIEQGVRRLLKLYF